MSLEALIVAQDQEAREMLTGTLKTAGQLVGHLVKNELINVAERFTKFLKK